MTEKATRLLQGKTSCKQVGEINGKTLIKHRLTASLRQGITIKLRQYEYDKQEFQETGSDKINPAVG